MSFFPSQNWRQAHTPLWKDPPFPSYFTLLVLILPSYKWSNRAFTAAGSWISKPLVNVLNDKGRIMKKGRMCITLLKIGSIKKNTLTEHHFSSFLLHLCVPSHRCPSPSPSVYAINIVTVLSDFPKSFQFCWGSLKHTLKEKWRRAVYKLLTYTADLWTKETLGCFWPLRSRYMLSPHASFIFYGGVQLSLHRLLCGENPGIWARWE